MRTSHSLQLQSQSVPTHSCCASSGLCNIYSGSPVGVIPSHLRSWGFQREAKLREIEAKAAAIKVATDEDMATYLKLRQVVLTALCTQ